MAALRTSVWEKPHSGKELQQVSIMSAMANVQQDTAGRYLALAGKPGKLLFDTLITMISNICPSQLDCAFWTWHVSAVICVISNHTKLCVRRGLLCDSAISK